jgi:hypothetical protein
MKKMDMASLWPWLLLLSVALAPVRAADPSECPSAAGIDFAVMIDSSLSQSPGFFTAARSFASALLASLPVSRANTR